MFIKASAQDPFQIDGIDVKKEWPFRVQRLDIAHLNLTDLCFLRNVNSENSIHAERLKRTRDFQAMS